MAQVNLGSIKFNWKGAYNAGTAYAIDDVVSYNGSSYVAKTATTGNLPTVTANWDLMSQAGTNGTNGTDLTSTLTTQGDIVYRDGSGLQRLGAGTSGQLLTTGGSGANPSWTTVDSGGVIQTKYYTTGNSFTYSSTSWGTLGSMSVTITPTSASNKIYLFFQCGSAQGNDSGNNTTGIRFYNGSSIVAGGATNANRTPAGSRVVGASYNSPNHAQSCTMLGIDSPNSTSAITYTVQCKNENGTSYWGRAQNYANDGEIYNATFRTTFIAQEIKY
jgi:hypothetical protein